MFHPTLEINLLDFIKSMNECKVGEFVLNSVNHDGMMNGFDIDLINFFSKKIDTPLIVAGGAGDPNDFKALFKSGFNDAVASSSIYHFTQYTPLDVKCALKEINIPVRI